MSKLIVLTRAGSNDAAELHAFIRHLHSSTDPNSFASHSSTRVVGGAAIVDVVIFAGTIALAMTPTEALVLAAKLTNTVANRM